MRPSVLIMGMSVLARRFLYIETGSWSSVLLYAILDYVNNGGGGTDILKYDMMTSSNGSIFRVTGPLSGEFTGHRWIPLTKACDVEF